mmetsp:Transcript_5083/g.6461  ORF Transcript_5083/g.6461 Transcript_5083/m.6461 type:complete len:193 (-) Transcript_5083:20-598(-)
MADFQPQKPPHRPPKPSSPPTYSSSSSSSSFPPPFTHSLSSPPCSTFSSYPFPPQVRKSIDIHMKIVMEELKARLVTVKKIEEKEASSPLGVPAHVVVISLNGREVTSIFSSQYPFIPPLVCVLHTSTMGSNKQTFFQLDWTWGEASKSDKILWKGFSSFLQINQGDPKAAFHVTAHAKEYRTKPLLSNFVR